MNALALLLAFTGLSTAGGQAHVDRAELSVTLSNGALEVRAGGRLLHRSGADEQVLGWAALDGEALLVWFLRRDENERGVVPHDSGWMSYGHAPTINHHLGVYGLHGGEWAPRWVSSALPFSVEGVALDGHDVLLKERGGRTSRWRFSGHALDLSQDPAPDIPTSSTGLVELAIAGDVMLGRAVGRQLSQLGYASAFDAVRPALKRADLRLANLESCFSAEPAADGPMKFTAPLEHLAALSYLSWSAVSVTNNHCSPRDREYSAKVLARAGIGAAGVVRREVNGVKVAVVAYNLIDETPDLSPLDAIAQSSDLVVALVHWGTEYRSAPDSTQRAFAARLLSHGVTLIAGAHPHVVQPYEWLDGHLVAYSLGNFVFDQEGWPTGAGQETERGALLRVQWHRRLGVTASTVQTRIEARYRVTLESKAEGVIHPTTINP